MSLLIQYDCCDVIKENGYHGTILISKQRQLGPDVMDPASDSDNRDNRRRPQVVRPRPRPFLSGSSLNENTTQGVSTSSYDSVFHHPRSRTPSTSTEQDKTPSSDSFLPGTAIVESPTSSPISLDGQRSFSPTPSLTTSTAPLRRSRPVLKPSLLSNGSSSASDQLETDEPPQSRRRWDDLRRHFLHAHTSSQASHASVQPSTAPPPNPFTDLPQRSSTPKQFRIPKFGFKQVVEHAQGSVVDQNKRFADDILSASRAMRVIEPKAQRREREGTLTTMATSFNMNFMNSGASLGMASLATPNYLPQSRSKARRPPSLQSQASQLPLAAAAPLYSIVAYHASNSSSKLHVAKFLPHENEVLSALLVPFMAPRSEAADSERVQAMETFETIVRTWQAASDEASSILFICRCRINYESGP
jgi:hypothetical protein